MENEKCGCNTENIKESPIKKIKSDNGCGCPEEKPKTNKKEDDCGCGCGSLKKSD